ncbi:predicted protein [Nematostella vectensis]|uniref:Guanine deaminase n=1 Tax=Nematostella vectensis TaxID=45351 RepID=A7SC37_NEMVE|nr:predicted protein [Nematostella vectensis]|eukprot:XP_001630802.1 predicted protein [Nematostella vectensis]
MAACCEEDTTGRVFVGTFVHSTDENHLEIHKDKVIGVNSQGKIFFIDNADRFELTENFSGCKFSHLSERQFLIPGFVDTHIHASQYSYAGTGYDLPLLKWLEKYTFPVESKFQDVGFAKRNYEKVVERTLRNGTTTASYFATIHLEATKILSDVCEKYNQRAFIGKVNMDINSPNYYIEDTLKSVADTEEFIDYVQRKRNPLITPVITPRFAVSCSFKLLKLLGDLAREYDIPVQSHMSENKAEIEFVRREFPQYEHYAGVYGEAGLLSEKTYMAHCCHLCDNETELVALSGTGVSHCPTSNFNIRSGLADVRYLSDRKIKVGLGTDVSGGHSPSMLHALRQAINTSNILAITREGNYTPINYKDAFYYATLGGSKVLGLEKKIGNFQVGKDFDAVLVDPDASDSPFDCFDEDNIDVVVQKFLYLGDDRNLKRVFVSGKLVSVMTGVPFKSS